MKYTMKVMPMIMGTGYIIHEHPKPSGEALLKGFEKNLQWLKVLEHLE